VTGTEYLPALPRRHDREAIVRTEKNCLCKMEIYYYSSAGAAVYDAP
jgi:hypothetical protein